MGLEGHTSTTGPVSEPKQTPRGLRQEIKGRETADPRLAGVSLVFPLSKADGEPAYWLPASLCIGPGIKGLACRRGGGKFRRNVRLGSPQHPRGEKPASPSSFGKGLLEEMEAEFSSFLPHGTSTSSGQFQAALFKYFSSSELVFLGWHCPLGTQKPSEDSMGQATKHTNLYHCFFNSPYKQYHIFFFLCLTYLLAQWLFSFVISRTSYKWKYNV